MFKLIQKWGQCMAKKPKGVARRLRHELPSVELIPVKVEKDDATMRRQEVIDMVAKMVLLGTKLGRPSLRDEDIKDAA